MVHAFKTRTQEGEAGVIYELEASLVSRVSPRTTRPTQRNPVPQTTKENKNYSV